MAQQAEQRKELAGSARLVMVQGATLLRPEQAVFEAMLAGWRCQQRSRLLAELTVTWRVRPSGSCLAAAGAAVAAHGSHPSSRCKKWSGRRLRFKGRPASKGCCNFQRRKETIIAT